MEKMIIREALDTDLESVLFTHRQAFGQEEEAGLVRDLLDDPSAAPFLSLLACMGGRPIGHVLFTRARLEPMAPLSVSILAPLAVIPQFQRQGVGIKLTEHGLAILTESGTDLVFVLGHPEYYPRFGFEPAGRLGFEATFPIPDKNAAAWMVKALGPGVIGSYQGRVICADKLNEPEFWKE